MNGLNDDFQLPFSVLDPIIGDVYSVRWERELIRETGSALKILTGEVLLQIGMTVLQETIMSFNVFFSVRKCLLLIYRRVFMMYFPQS